MELTPLERAVLDALLAGDHPTLVTLRDQLAQARPTNRELTGVGFFVEFEAPHVGGNYHLGHVDAEIEGLANGADFILFVVDGRIAMLAFPTASPGPPRSRPSRSARPHLAI